MNFVHADQPEKGAGSGKENFADRVNICFVGALRRVILLGANTLFSEQNCNLKNPWCCARLCAGIMAKGHVT